MKIFIGTDHRGYTIENELINRLKEKNYEVLTSNIEHNSEDDYVDFAFDVCKRMDKIEDIGILICGNGVGMSIAANKIKGIRCARVTNKEDAIAARSHNGANVIALGTFDINEMFEIITTFINTPIPTEERHLRRVNKIINFENGEYNAL